MGYYTKKVPQAINTVTKPLKGVPLECFARGTTVIIEGKEKIKEDLINLLTISEGEIFFDPQAGSSLFDCVFELNDFVLNDVITYKVTEAVTKNISQVEVVDVQVKQYIDNNYISVYVAYNITTLGITDEITIYKDIKESLGGEL